MSKSQQLVNQVIAKVKALDPDQAEFQQAVEEVLTTLVPALDAHPEFADPALLFRMVEPERSIIFRVPWVDDKGETQVNRGFRVQFNSAIGPYKGGLRFHPTVNHSVLKFLGFEQVFKNSLTGLPLGGGKGGSDFDPKGKSDGEVMRFCQSFMTELSRHVGSDRDVPAGDIGVGGREIGFLFGQYKRLRNEFVGVLTGKEMSFGGSLIRPEATGFGTIYFTREMLKASGRNGGDKENVLKGTRIIISGSGNVAQFAAVKAMALEAKVLTLSDSNGFIFAQDGLTQQQLDFIVDLKNVKRGRLSEAATAFPSALKYTPVDPKAATNPLWEVKADIALPCATQNEINKEDAKHLVSNGVWAVAEGANMPSTLAAANVFLNAKVLYGPAKAVNAGGVATSGLEMSQNSMRLSWTYDEVDAKLDAIMTEIHRNALQTAKDLGHDGNYLLGANCAGFLKVATAMKAQGIV